MIVTAAPDKRPYHHGNLGQALVAAGVELAREGGPSAIVLREAARRVGVSPNAAYRHFTALPDLIEAVSREALTALAKAMQREVARCKPTGDQRRDAWERMRGVGRGYVHFALREPGLFAVAFDRSRGIEPAPKGTDPDALGPDDMLLRGLDGLVEAGLLAATDIDAAATLAWSAVHGLSMLLLGPLNGLKKAERDQVIEATLVRIGDGLLARQ